MPNSTPNALAVRVLALTGWQQRVVSLQISLSNTCQALQRWGRLRVAPSRRRGRLGSAVGAMSRV